MNTEYISVGKASGMLNALPDHIRLAASQLNITPAMVIDNVPMFSPAQIDRIAAVVQQTASIEVARRAQGLR